MQGAAEGCSSVWFGRVREELTFLLVQRVVLGPLCRHIVCSFAFGVGKSSEVAAWSTRRVAPRAS